MNIQIMSDLHLEHDNSFKFEKAENADILILAGDISSYTFQSDFVRECASQITTIMIMGNHEPLGYSIKETVEAWKALNIPNLYILDNETIEINGVHFIGSTLWSNINADPINQIAIKNAFCDFKKIFNEQKTDLISIADYQREFEKSLYFIENELAKGYKKTVLITHHLPTFSSISDRFINSPFNAGMASNLSNLLLYNDNLVLAIHGHTHDSMDYMLGDTVRIVCNPRGYYGENKDFNPLKVVSI